MINISLDEAYVFDLLSIYEVKIEKSTGEKKDSLILLYDNLSQEIINQIGFDLFDKIILSNEYNKLKNANEITFELVGRSNECELSKLTAESNYNRYIIKNELQQKFFEKNLTEIKI